MRNAFHCVLTRSYCRLNIKSRDVAYALLAKYVQRIQRASRDVYSGCATYTAYYTIQIHHPRSNWDDESHSKSSNAPSECDGF